MSEASALRNIIENNRNEKGQNIFDHLSEVFTYVLKDNQENFFERFEQYSSFIKKTTFQYKEPQTSQEVNSIPPRLNDLSEWLRDSLALLQKPQRRTEQGYTVNIVPKPLNMMPDLLQDAELFKWAGVDFGEEQVYLLHMSLKRLIENTGADELRFWGKIYGTQKDYYIAEGLLKSAPPETLDRPKEFEPRGTGVNRMTYWVTDNFLEDWVELPDVTPEQVKASRYIKRLLTGDLNANVNTFPLFPGKERHLLRCQIARIAHGCTLVPKGIFGLDEETNEIKPEEEIIVPGFDELLTEEGWIHLHPNILNVGRITHYVPEVPEGEEAEADEALEALRADDPELAKLAPLVEDLPFQNYEKSWLVSISGDDQQYARKEGEGNDCYGVNVLKSLRWPGSLTVFKGGRWANIYVGYGVKAGALPFYPTAPPDVQEEPVDPYEEYEPHPKEAPKEESDEEKKDSDEEED